MIESTEDKKVRDAIIVKALFDGHIKNSDDHVHTLTVKGFVGANIIAARMALEILQRPILENDIREVIKFLKDAESALDMLEETQE